MTAAFRRGAKGDLVSVLQRGLQAQGFDPGGVDGDFGGRTETAVRAFQGGAGRPVTGAVEAADWESVVGQPWPELFTRCLQLTARFEGHSYGKVVGNFDGAGLTWGVIGFTLQHGGLGSLVLEADAGEPRLLGDCFGEAAADELRSRLRDDSAAERLAWADSISVPPSKVQVAEPWRSGFLCLGEAPLPQELQRRKAREKYFDPAVVTAGRLGLTSDRGIALCFDVHVQNGGVKQASEQVYQQEVAALPAGGTERDRRSILARLVADSSRPQFRADVLSRKSCIAVGTGAVHGEPFDLDSWALADG